jgi:hypothetical protein
MTTPDSVPSGLYTIFASRNVPSGNPASYLGRLELFADRVRDALVLMCMTDKDVVRHPITSLHYIRVLCRKIKPLRGVARVLSKTWV